MALQRQLIDLTMESGIDTKTDSINLNPPSVSDLVNLRFPTKGALTPRKQFTTKTTFTATSSNFVVGVRDVIYAEADTRLYQLADTVKTNLVSHWSPNGKVITLGTRINSVGGSTSQVTSSILSNGNVFCTWLSQVTISGTTTAYVGYQFLLPNGDRLTGGTQSLGTGSDKFVTSTSGPNDTGYIWVLNSAGTLSGYSVSGNTVTALTVPSLTNVSRLSIRWSATDSAFIAIYSTTAPTTAIAKWTISGTTVTAGTPVTVFAGFCKCVDVVRTTTYIAALYWNESTGAIVCKYYTSSLVLSATQNIDTNTTAYDRESGFGGCETATTDEIVLNFTATNQSSGNLMSTYKVPYSGSITTIRALRGCGFTATSRPAFYNGSVYIAAIDYVVPGAQTYSLIQICDLSGNGVTNPLESVCFWHSGAGYQTPSIFNTAGSPNNYDANLGNGSTFLLAPSTFLSEVTNEDYFSTLTKSAGMQPYFGSFATLGTSVATVLRLDKDEVSKTASYSFGTSSMIAGTSIKGIDGTGVAPGCLWPNFSTLDMELVAASTPLSNGNTYFYVFVKVWTDSLGNRHSLESLPVRVQGAIITGTDYFRANFYIPAGAFDIPNMSSGAQQYADIDVYRTESNGTVPYYITTVFQANAGVFSDTVTSVQLSRPLLSSSGDLPTTPPPLIRSSTTWKTRIAALVGDSDTSIWYTKPNENFKFPAFANGLEIPIPQATDQLIALSSMDGVLYAFNRNQVFTIYGDPAGATGEGGSLSIPEIRFNGVGCSDPESVILTPRGIFFKSDKGFYVILRNQELVFIGDGPFATRTDDIVGAWCDEKTSEVGFASADEMWTYDWEARAWSKSDTTLTSGGDITGASLIQGQPTILNEDGIYQMTESDVSEVYPISVSTAWIKLSGLQNYQRIYNTYLMFKYRLAHTLVINLYVDYKDTPVYTWTILSSDIATLDPEQVRLSMPVQKCEAFKLSISSTTPGWSLHGIQADIGVKPTGYKQRQDANNF